MKLAPETGLAAGCADFVTSIQARLLVRVFSVAERLLEHQYLRLHSGHSGFLPAEEVGRALAAADAIVLPFRGGGGPWNTTLQAARLQTTFVLTTASPASGYDAGDHLFWADPHDLEAMRRALQDYAGIRAAAPRQGLATWDAVADAHLALYRAELRL